MSGKTADIIGDDMGRTAVIIGGGMGGLITGAMFSRAGWRVTVLEKNRNVGGGLQTFRRGGAEFSPGMHLVGGRDGGSAAGLLRSLGVEVRLESCDMTVKLPAQTDCADSGAASDGQDAEFAEYHIPQGMDDFVEYFSGLFPECSGEIRRYVARMQEIHDSVPLLKAGSGLSAECGLASLFADGREASYLPEGDALMPADEFVAKYISDIRLRTVLGWLNPLSGVIPGVTPAYVHSIINILYISGASKFAGGTKHIVEQLVRIIESSGGMVKAGCAATEVIVGQDGSEGAPAEGRPVAQDSTGRRKVAGVKGSDGNVYTADAYISDIHPSALAALCPQDAFPKAYRRRLAAQRPGISMFSLYINLRDGGRSSLDDLAEGRGIGTSGFVASSGLARFIMDGDAGSALQPWGEIMYVRDGNAVTVMTPMSCEEVAQWTDTTSGNRPKEYEQWLAERTEQVLDRIERAEPGFRSRIEACWPASPLTLGKYLGDPDGAAYGFRIDSSSPSYSRFGPKTYLRNLYMTGQNVGLHGLCGVSMSSIMAVNAILAESRRLGERDDENR